MIVIMTIWRPSPASLAGVTGPRYRAIADRLARDIARGRLAPGARLPTHRALATQLGVTVGTVTRAYREVERLGLVTGEVGRGTFVREPPHAATLPPAEGERADLIDLSRNVPDPRPAAKPMRAALRELAARGDLDALLDYQPPAGAERHREAGAHWLAQAGLDADPAQVVVTAGVQHALAVALAALAQPGDAVLTASLTYPGLIALARMLRLRLYGVELDAHGLRPDALEAACTARAPRALYCMPNVQNPTTAVMPEGRRREIAAIARRHGVAVIEDDIWGFLPGRRAAPLASHAPESSYYATSLSKSAAPALRVGYLRVPPASLEPVAASLRSTVWMAPPLTAEIATMWIRDGTAARLVAAQRSEARARVSLARRVLAGLDVSAPPESFHVWLQLPEPWRAAEFCAQARVRGVAVLPAEAFAVGRAGAPHAARVCTGAARSRAELERGLRVLAELARAGPAAGETPL